MRPAFAGPGSASSRWKPTQDPGKTSASSNSGNRSGGSDNAGGSKGQSGDGKKE